MADMLADFMNQFTAKGIPSILVVGGIVSAFLLPMLVGPQWKPLLLGGGFMSIGAGIYGMLNAPVGSKAFFGGGGLGPAEIQNTKYSNPVNNIGYTNPRNRFDKQSNYVLPPSQYNTFDNYINDKIMDEIKSMGLDNSIGNYPIKVNPWEIKTLIPTTQVDPIRDFNTVRVIPANA